MAASIPLDPNDELHRNTPNHRPMLEVGILRPNWLDGANYLGQRHVDGFLCNVWEKVEFIWYYEDVVSKRPVHWEFYTGRNAHVMTFEVGAVLEDSKWQAPPDCFQSESHHQNPLTLPQFSISSHMIHHHRHDSSSSSS
ncbi:hypothetical protein G4B88_015484 [Cannabis sativa]|nr:hypothetical protein G4B88_015484 [Cannabis sativa]